MTSGLFVTGTDTGVGKTTVAAGILRVLADRGYQARPLKPVETGWPPEADWPRDAACLARAARREDLDREEVCPLAFEEPVAPSVAARRAERPVELDRLDRAYEAAREDADVVLVEGAGGLLVPVTEGTTMADMAKRWKLSMLVVARPSLGTLNHTALTVEHARHRGLDLVGIVLCRWPDDPDVATRTNPAELERLTGVPVLGRLPEIDALDTEIPDLDGLHDAVETHLDLAPILDSIDRSPTHVPA